MQGQFTLTVPSTCEWGDMILRTRAQKPLAAHAASTARGRELRAVTEVNFAASNQFEYIDGQLRPAQDALFNQIAANNDRAVADAKPDLDIAYGRHPRQRLDLFRTERKRRGAVAYFHAGYWQSRDKERLSVSGPTARGRRLRRGPHQLSAESRHGRGATSLRPHTHRSRLLLRFPRTRR